MTCIVGFASEGKVYIGADSSAVAGWNVSSTALRKVYRVGEFLIAYAGSFRMGQIIQYHLTVPQQQDGITDERFMVTSFVEAVRTCLKDKGYTKVENNRESGACLLVGYKGILYQIDDDFQVNHFRDGLMSVGVGSEYALGAMAALDDLPPAKRIKKALKISSRFCGGVCGPYIVESL